MRVLIVDSYSTMRRILKNLLVQIGYTAIEEAADGGGAMEKLKVVPFDLVISDWNMEPVSGLQLLRSDLMEQDIEAGSLKPWRCAYRKNRLLR